MVGRHGGSGVADDAQELRRAEVSFPVDATNGFGGGGSVGGVGFA